MRALCGAIIAAGAMIGLGLTAIGIGHRYSMEHAFGTDGEPILVKLSMMDRPLIFILVFTVSVAIIGLAIAIAGLAYHHHRRDQQFTWHKERTGVPRPTA